jgi:hypothetical protein
LLPLLERIAGGIQLPLWKVVRALSARAARDSGVSHKQISEGEFHVAGSQIVLREKGSGKWVLESGGRKIEFVTGKGLKRLLVEALKNLPGDLPEESRDRRVRYRDPTPEEVKEVRSLARAIGRKHGAKIGVTYNKRGSQAGTMTVQNLEYPHPELPKMKIELLRELIKRGYENSLIRYSPDSSLRKEVRMTAQYENARIYMTLFKVV